MFVNLGYRENLQLLNDVRVWPARQLWVEPWGTARSEQLSNGKPQDNLPILTPRTELHPEWEQP